MACSLTAPRHYLHQYWLQIRTANISWRTCVVVKQMQSNPIQIIGIHPSAIFTENAWDMLAKIIFWKWASIKICMHLSGNDELMHLTGDSTTLYSRTCFLSLAWSKLRLCSANYRPGYWSNLPCDWLSTAWAYSEEETENNPL